MPFDAKLLSIPLISGIIGYVTNYVGIKMLFYPVQFVGFTIPGIAPLGRLLPRKLQSIPGVLTGQVGWQGVIPSRAAKMGSIAVDTGVSKLGSPGEFYEKLNPERIAEHILTTSRADIRELVERLIDREYGRLWRDAPSAVREMVHERVQAQLPAIVHRVTEEIGANIDQILDIKLMVIRHIEAHPELANAIFLEVGEKELKFVINAGAYYGFALGIPSIFVFSAVQQWWVLPIAGIIVGYLTNFIAIKQIFLPIVPTKYGPITLHGLFMRRQPEVSRQYAKLIATEVVNLQNIGQEFMTGRRSDRTKAMIASALRPAIDGAVGPLRRAVRLAVGPAQYDAIKESMATEALDYTLVPLSDPEFNASQAKELEDLLTERMKALPPHDFAELLRTAVEEDEWMLMFIGAVLGFAAGVLQTAFTLV
ncbi:hypothetical protein DVS28_a4722 [Euzebya pacifica]|uniref:DUF445 family protein n=1 Tax=Euzebya pacifica TaxID=1608957 RepID=A0A346Y4I6_9ACTN|nr:hypothetical protein [Euzebya pacifica]AXV09383.1 hypothetical protein DVS28_a4722 [Euzebya pacifica]